MELERQATSYIDETLSQVELQIKDNEDYFAGDSQGAFANFFESLFNLFEVNVDPKVYKMLKEKKEKNLLLSIIKFLRDKLKELVKKIFKKDLDLSWDKRLDKEIKNCRRNYSVVQVISGRGNSNTRTFASVAKFKIEASNFSRGLSHCNVCRNFCS